MEMRDLITIVENVQSIDRAAIIAKMKNGVLKKQHWDEYGLRRFAELNPEYPEGFADTRSEEMARDWHEFEAMPTDKPEGPEFLAMMDKWADEAYEDAVERIGDAEVVDGKYLIHRSMRVPPEWLASIKPDISLGIYWTYAPDEWDFYPVWGPEDGVEIEIEALAPSSSINWESTLLTNMEYGSISHEYEMRLIQGAPIEVRQIVSKGEVVHGPFRARG